MLTKSWFILFLVMCFTLFSCGTSGDVVDDSEEIEKSDLPPIPFGEIKANQADNVQPVKINEDKDDETITKVNLTPPKNIELMRIAEDSIEGYYIPTFDFAERGELAKYALVINNEDENKFSWCLCNINENSKHEIISGGFFTKFEESIELSELSLDSNESSTGISGAKELAKEKFSAKFSKNELFIGKAFESDGKSSLSKLIEKYEKLYFIRIADVSDPPLPTSPIIGKFHPTDKETGNKVEDATFYIWSNGIWCVEAPASYFHAMNNNTDSSDSTKVKIKGTWTISGNKITFTRSTKCLLDPENADIEVETPLETYEFAFDTENFILWLTVYKKSSHAPVGISKYLEYDETSVYLP